MNAPLIYKRRPQWGDTDAAQIVYTGRIADYILEAIDHFMREVLEMPWFELNIDEHIGTPFVSVKYDIFSPLTPRSDLHCKVLVSKVGQTSVGFHVTILNDEGLKCVFAETVNVFVNNQSMTKIDIPEKYRDRLEYYVQVCGGIDE